MDHRQHTALEKLVVGKGSLIASDTMDACPCDVASEVNLTYRPGYVASSRDGSRVGGHGRERLREAYWVPSDTLAQRQNVKWLKRYMRSTHPREVAELRKRYRLLGGVEAPWGHMDDPRCQDEFVDECERLVIKIGIDKR